MLVIGMLDDVVVVAKVVVKTVMEGTDDVVAIGLATGTCTVDNDDVEGKSPVETVNSVCNESGIVVANRVVVDDTVLETVSVVVRVVEVEDVVAISRPPPSCLAETWS